MVWQWTPQKIHLHTFHMQQKRIFQILHYPSYIIIPDCPHSFASFSFHDQNLFGKERINISANKYMVSEIVATLSPIWMCNPIYFHSHDLSSENENFMTLSKGKNVIISKN